MNVEKGNLPVTCVSSADKESIPPKNQTAPFSSCANSEDAGVPLASNTVNNKFFDEWPESAPPLPRDVHPSKLKKLGEISLEDIDVCHILEQVQRGEIDYFEATSLLQKRGVNPYNYTSKKHGWAVMRDNIRQLQKDYRATATKKFWMVACHYRYKKDHPDHIPSNFPETKESLKYFPHTYYSFVVMIQAKEKAMRQSGETIMTVPTSTSTSTSTMPETKESMMVEEGEIMEELAIPEQPDLETQLPVRTPGTEAAGAKKGRVDLLAQLYSDQKRIVQKALSDKADFEAKLQAAIAEAHAAKVWALAEVKAAKAEAAEAANTEKMRRRQQVELNDVQKQLDANLSERTSLNEKLQTAKSAVAAAEKERDELKLQLLCEQQLLMAALNQHTNLNEKFQKALTDKADLESKLHAAKAEAHAAKAEAANAGNMYYLLVMRLQDTQQLLKEALATKDEGEAAKPEAATDGNIKQDFQLRDTQQLLKESLADKADLESKLRAANEKAATERDDVQSKLDDALQTLHGALADLNDAERKVQRSQASATAAEIERDGLQFQLDGALQQLRDRSDIVTKAAAADIEFDGLKFQLNDAQQQLDVACNERTNLNGKLQTAKSAAAAAEKEREELKSQLHCAQQLLKAALNQRTDLNEKLQTAEARDEASLKERDELKSQLNATQQELKSLHSELAGLEEKLQVAQADANATGIERERLEVKLRNAQQQFETALGDQTAKIESEGLQRQLSIAKQQLRAAFSERNDLETKLQDNQTRLQTALVAASPILMEKLQSKLDGAQQQLKIARTKGTELEAKLQSALAKAVGAENERNELQVQLKGAHEELKIALARRIDLETKLGVAQKNRNSLQSRLTQTQQQLNKLKITMASNQQEKPASDQRPKRSGASERSKGNTANDSELARSNQHLKGTIAKLQAKCRSKGEELRKSQETQECLAVQLDSLKTVNAGYGVIQKALKCSQDLEEQLKSELNNALQENGRLSAQLAETKKALELQVSKNVAAMAEQEIERLSAQLAETKKALELQESKNVASMAARDMALRDNRQEEDHEQRSESLRRKAVQQPRRHANKETQRQKQRVGIEMKKTAAVAEEDQNSESMSTGELGLARQGSSPAPDSSLSTNTIDPDGMKAVQGSTPAPDSCLSTHAIDPDGMNAVKQPICKKKRAASNEAAKGKHDDNPMITDYPRSKKARKSPQEGASAPPNNRPTAQVRVKCEDVPPSADRSSVLPSAAIKTEAAAAPPAAVKLDDDVSFRFVRHDDSRGQGQSVTHELKRADIEGMTGEDLCKLPQQRNSVLVDESTWNMVKKGKLVMYFKWKGSSARWQLPHDAFFKLDASKILSLGCEQKPLTVTVSVGTSPPF